MISINLQWIRTALPNLSIKKTVVIGLIGLNLWLIYVAASWGLADLFAKQARYEMLQWDKQGVITTDNWKSTHATLKWARYLEVYHPDFLEDMAEMNYLLYRYGIATAAEKFMALQQALDYDMQAIRQRPVSAYTWANIAIVKNNLRQYDAQFIAALENASVLGSWEPFVQHAIADIGLGAWYRFPKQERENGQALVFAAVKRGMLRQAKLMRRLIKKHRRQYVMCLYSRGKIEFADFCP